MGLFNVEIQRPDLDVKDVFVRSAVSLKGLKLRELVTEPSTATVTTQIKAHTVQLSGITRAKLCS